MEKTVFIVGAGASKEFGLPTGYELKSQISAICDIRFDEFGSRLKSGDHRLVEALRQQVRQTGPSGGSINPYLHAAWKIRDNMALAPSIDNFLDTHRDDPMVVEFGKIAIAKAIMSAEKSSNLWFNSKNFDARPDFDSLSETWLQRLFTILVAQSSFENFCEALASVSFVSFNYDRCIHHFLLLAAQQYFNLSDEQVKKVSDNINVLYAYGSVGLAKPGQKGISDFGEEPIGTALFERAARIRTFTEGTDSESREAIQKVIRTASCCVFVGFGFLPLNMSLLFEGNRVERVKVIGTVKGLSINSSKTLLEELELIFGTSSNGVTQNFDLKRHPSLENMTCGQLMFEYERFFSQRFGR